MQRYGMPIGKSAKRLRYYKKQIQLFQKNKIRYLWVNGDLEEYLLATDEQAALGFDELKDRLFQLDQDLVKKVADLSGFAWSDLVTPGTAKIVKQWGLKKELEKVGLKTSDFTRFLRVFQNLALATAVRLLVKSENIVSSELKRYANPSELNKVASVLKNDFGPKFLAANELLVDVIMKLQTDKNIDLGGISNPAGRAALLADKNFRTLAFGSRKEVSELIKRRGRKKIQAYLPQALMVMRINSKDEGEIKALLEKRYPDMVKAREDEKKTYQELYKLGREKFPVLSDVSKNFAVLSQHDSSKIAKQILKLLKKKGPDARTTKRRLKRFPDKVWQLKPLILMTMMDEGISQDDNLGIIVLDKVADVDREKLFTSLGLAALGIVLGIAGFFTGGTTWAGLALIGGAATVSFVDFMNEYSDYELHSDAAAAAFEESLTVEPSAFGLVLAAFGVVIDVADVVKHAARIIKPAAEAMSATDDVDAVRKAAGELYDRLSRETLPDYPNGLLRPGAMSREEFIEEFAKLTEKRATRKSKMSGVLLDHMKKADFDNLDGPIQDGLLHIYDVNPGTFEMILTNFAQNPEILTRLGISVYKDRTLAATLMQVHARMGSKAPDVFRFYGGIGNAHIEQLTDVMSVIVHHKITDKGLLTQLLKSRRLQKGLLAKAHKRGYFNELWQDYHARKANLKSTSFLEYVGYRKVPTKLAGGETLADMLGDDYIKLTKEFDRNMVLLRKIDSELAERMSKSAADSGLSEKMYAKLLEILNQDLMQKLPIDQRGFYAPARRRLTRDLAQAASTALRAPKKGQKFLSDARKARKILQKTFPDIFKKNEVLQKYWDEAWAAAKSQKFVGRKEARNAFNLQRDRFWRRVYADPNAKKPFEEAGFVFTGPKAPKIPGFPAWFGKLSIDHIIEISADSTIAVTASNLRFVIAGDNTILSTLGRGMEKHFKKFLNKELQDAGLRDWPTNKIVWIEDP